MTITLADRTDKQVFMLVEFTTTEQEFRYTDHVETIISEDGIFDIPEPTMDIKLPPNTGTFEGKVLSVDLPFIPDSFVDDVSAQRPYPQVTVKVYEHYIAGGNAETYLMFWGTLTKATKNREGREGRVVIEAKSSKALFKVPAGPIISHQCPWIFGGNGCQKSFIGLTENVKIDSISTVTITTRPLKSSYRDNRHFIRGVVTVEGLAITIASWDRTKSNEFVLTKEPPRSWVGKLALFEPGCEKSIEQCEFWVNTKNFGGIGFAIPEYNPIIEQE